MNNKFNIIYRRSGQYATVCLTYRFHLRFGPKTMGVPYIPVRSKTQNDGTFFFTRIQKNFFLKHTYSYEHFFLVLLYVPVGNLEKNAIQKISPCRFKTICVTDFIAFFIAEEREILLWLYFQPS